MSDPSPGPREAAEPVVVEPAGGLVGAIAAIGRGGAVVVAAPRLVASLASDLRRVAVATAEMAQYTRVLPLVAERLGEIADRVERLEADVAQMTGDVGVMRSDVTDLPTAIDGLEARLERVEMAMSPLRRARRGLRRGERREDGPPLDPDAPDPGGEAPID